MEINDIDEWVIDTCRMTPEQRLKLIHEAQRWIKYRYSNLWWENVVIALLQELQATKKEIDNE